MVNFSKFVRSTFVLNSVNEEEMSFDVKIPEGEVPFDWLADLVIRVTAVQVEMQADQITLESRFEQDLYADSLDIVEINMKLERILNIKVPDYCISFIVTVEDAVLIIHRIINGIGLPEDWNPESRKK